MGLALAAELNGYPGPMHLLELADQLALTADQREAIQLGENLIAQEAALDRLFAGRTVTPQTLQAATAAIGETQARLRDTHLKYHLSTAAVLQPQQLHRYAELRGYTGTGPAPGHMHKHGSN